MKQALRLALTISAAAVALATVACAQALASELARDYGYDGPCGKGRLIIEKVGAMWDRDPKVTEIRAILELNDGRVLGGRGYELNKAYELDEIYKFECHQAHEHDVNCRMRFIPEMERISFEVHDKDRVWEHEIIVQDGRGEGKASVNTAPKTVLTWHLSLVPPMAPRDLVAP